MQLNVQSCNSFVKVNSLLQVKNVHLELNKKHIKHCLFLFKTFDIDENGLGIDCAVFQIGRRRITVFKAYP